MGIEYCVFGIDTEYRIPDTEYRLGLGSCSGYDRGSFFRYELSEGYERLDSISRVLSNSFYTFCAHPYYFGLSVNHNLYFLKVGFK